MARSQLVTTLKKYIDLYLDIPYAKNTWDDGVLKEEAIFGGKGKIDEIIKATEAACEQENKIVSSLDAKEIRKIRAKYHIGIDCSGLVYHLLDYYDRLQGFGGILFKVIGVDKPYGIYGVRSLSAKEIAHPQNSFQIRDLNEVQTGDVILTDKGGHILFIVEKLANEIIYVHSSHKTVTTGVHYGSILINSADPDLRLYTWSDETQTGLNYHKLFSPEMGDGIFRLNCWR